MASDMVAPPANKVALDATPLSSDELDLAVSPVHHPKIEHSWRVFRQSARLTNGITTRVKAWVESQDGFPPACVDEHGAVLEELHALQKELEQLDSMDLDQLQAEWSDRATVRAARKTLIAFAETVMSQLDMLQAVMAPHVRAAKEERDRARAEQSQLTAGKVESFHEKYRNVLEKHVDGEPPTKRQRPAGPAQTVLLTLIGAEIERTPSLGSAAADFEARLGRLQARVEIPEEQRTRTLKSLSKQLAKLAASPELEQSDARSGELCGEAFSTVVGTLTIAMEQKPNKKVVCTLLNLTKRLESVRDVKGFQDFLADLASAVKRI
eukprot:TRINITY_DN80080_c0_g1_i1.p1 TRINITY_DN80080_c0_g1~~TRINITY_DN80080_c0_g1_i1.p1  ORF type:complete len:324 (-),score=77.70 TRINITY_DN80080_c0_g1_i1:76-1047(-)